MKKSAFKRHFGLRPNPPRELSGLLNSIKKEPTGFKQPEVDFCPTGQFLRVAYIFHQHFLESHHGFIHFNRS